MAFMKWSDEYELGIPEMDKQHKRWLELLNKFYDNLEADNLKKHLVTLIDEALEYTNFHFREEEKLMNSIGFKEQENQKKMHDEISKKIETFRERLINDQPLVSMTITNEFKGWFKNHILLEDKKYAELYKSL